MSHLLIALCALRSLQSSSCQPLNSRNSIYPPQNLTAVFNGTQTTLGTLRWPPAPFTWRLDNSSPYSAYEMNVVEANPYDKPGVDVEQIRDNLVDFRLKLAEAESTSGSSDYKGINTGVSVLWAAGAELTTYVASHLFAKSAPLGLVLELLDMLAEAYTKHPPTSVKIVVREINAKGPAYWYELCTIEIKITEIPARPVDSLAGSKNVTEYSFQNEEQVSSIS